jgi:hypothetical protein
MAEGTATGGLPKVLVDSVASAIFTAIGGAVLHWLGLSVEGAICGGAILGLPAFVAVHGVLTNREMRKRLAALESRLSLPAPAPAESSAESHGGGSGRGGSATTSGQHAIAVGGSAWPKTVSSPVQVKRLTTQMSVGAIGIFKSISIQQFRPGNTARFRCLCEIDFFGISADKCSPAEIRLTSRGGTHLLAKLEAQGIAACPGKMFYEGSGDWSLGGHPKPATDGHLKTGHQ